MMVSPSAIRITRATEIIKGDEKNVPNPGNNEDKLRPSIGLVFWIVMVYKLLLRGFCVEPVIAIVMV